MRGYCYVTLNIKILCKSEDILSILRHFTKIVNRKERSNSENVLLNQDSNLVSAPIERVSSLRKCVCLLPLLHQASSDSHKGSYDIYAYKIVNEYEHDPQAFTQVMNFSVSQMLRASYVPINYASIKVYAPQMF